MSRLVWVAVPGGRGADGIGVLRVLVIPMLDGGRSLDEEGMGSWPPEHSSASRRRSGSPRPRAQERPPTCPRTSRLGSAWSPSLWQEFFGGDITVFPPGGGVDRVIDVDPHDRAR